jgi:hypothetical protein
MFDKRSLTEEELKDKDDFYSETVELIVKNIFDDSAVSSLGKTFLEGLLHGVSQNLEILKEKPPEDLKKLYQKFKSLEEYSVESLKEGLSAREKVKERLQAANKVFRA